MAKRILKEEQLIDVIWGATLMGGGGGGAMVGGTDLLDTYKKLHPEKPVELTLLETCDMDPEAYGAVTAGRPNVPSQRDRPSRWSEKIPPLPYR